MAKRARIVLLTSEGRSNREIGVLVGPQYNEVGIWRCSSVGLGGWATRSAAPARMCMGITM